MPSHSSATPDFSETVSSQLPAPAQLVNLSHTYLTPAGQAARWRTAD